MDDEGELPDPNMKIAVVAILPPLEAALLAGRLQADGVRAMISDGHAAPGPWAAIVGSTGVGLAPNFAQKRTAEVLVDERDIEKAHRIAARYVE
jgi:hypothetical protein